MFYKVWFLSILKVKFFNLVKYGWNYFVNVEKIFYKSEKNSNSSVSMKVWQLIEKNAQLWSSVLLKTKVLHWSVSRNKNLFWFEINV